MYMMYSHQIKCNVLSAADQSNQLPGFQLNRLKQNHQYFEGNSCRDSRSDMTAAMMQL